jgi:hypothetical protein
VITTIKKKETYLSKSEFKDGFIEIMWLEEDLDN